MEFLPVPAGRAPGNITVVAVEDVILLSPDLVGRFITGPAGRLINRDRIIKPGDIKIAQGALSVARV